ncbi:E3 ubiquitin-protein ligase ZNRF1 [Varanus komodoensis]|nr:E3 ubiquitin-protein ligase ZNRF1 [Varanus komodoensis]
MLYLGSRASLADALPLPLGPRWFSSHSGFKCPICSKSVASDEMEMHFIMCLSKPRLSYNDDVLTKDAGECVICLEELLQGDTIARLPCLCIYHKRFLVRSEQILPGTPFRLTLVMFADLSQGVKTLKSISKCRSSFWGDCSHEDWGRLRHVLCSCIDGFVDLLPGQSPPPSILPTYPFPSSRALEPGTNGDETRAGETPGEELLPLRAGSWPPPAREREQCCSVGDRLPPPLPARHDVCLAGPARPRAKRSLRVPAVRPCARPNRKGGPPTLLSHNLRKERAFPVSRRRCSVYKTAISCQLMFVPGDVYKTASSRPRGSNPCRGLELKTPRPLSLRPRPCPGDSPPHCQKSPGFSFLLVSV